MSQATQTTPIGAPVEEPAVPVSRPRFMFAFVVLYMLFLLDFSARLGVTSVFPAMQKALGLTDSQIGVAGSAVLCGMTLFVLPLSFIADKTSKKKAITLMSGLWGVGCLLCGLVSNFFLILLGRFMVGMGNASYAPVSVSMLTSWTKKSRWGSVIGLYNSSMSGTRRWDGRSGHSGAEHRLARAVHRDGRGDAAVHGAFHGSAEDFGQA